MLFISEKQITGFHRRLCECIHVFSSGLSLLFPCQYELAPHTATAKVSVRVCMSTYSSSGDLYNGFCYSQNR